MTNPTSLSGIPPRRVEQYVRAINNGDLTVAEIRAVELAGREHEAPEIVAQWQAQHCR